VGGRELAAIAGAVGRAAERRICVLVDGFITTAAVLAVVRANPAIRPYLLFGHRSAEPGHRHLLEALQARPLLDLGLRLGEGTGALAAYPLVELACALHHEMATFSAAGVATAGS
jgi:nicotinate-nucleotide--dimethylbenzimidazole phosphoribosyltransferase